MAMGRQRQFNLGVIIGALFNFIINLVLIPRYAAVGAAIASVFAEGIILAIFMYYSRDLVAPSMILGTALKYCIIAGIMFLMLNFWNYIALKPLTRMTVKILSGTIFYLLSLAILKDEIIITLAKKAQSLLRVLKKSQ